MINRLKKNIYAYFRRYGYELRKSKKNEFLYNPDISKYKLQNQFSEFVLKNEGYSLFFGYHDKTPFSLDGTKILVNRVKEYGTNFDCECTSEMEIGYFRKENNSFAQEFNKISHTFTWSWQQGCMLQWNPLKPNSQIFFNTLVKDKHGSVLYDIDRNEIIKEFDRPVYSISPKGDIATSINFRRVAEFRPGYGYRNFSEEQAFSPVSGTDGIHLIDLNTNKCQLVVSLKDFADFSEYEAPGYINHVRFSPDSKHFLFFHIIEGAGEKRIVSFYVYNIDDKKLTLLEASRRVSHFCWKNNHEIFASEIEGGYTYYFIYNIIDKTKKQVNMPDIGDVHPMISPADQNKLIIDTKPDINRFQHLFLFDLKACRLEHVAKYRLPKGFKNAVRCDLHPRWDHSGKHLSIDTVENRYRIMTILQAIEG